MKNSYDLKKIKALLKLRDYKKIMDHIYDQIYVTNAKGKVLYVNHATEKNYGVKPEKFIGQNSKVLVDKGYYTPLTGPLVRKDKEIISFEEKTVLGKTLVCTAVPLLDESGAIEFVIYSSRDINALGRITHDFDHTRELLTKMKEEIKELRSRDLRMPDFIAVSNEMQDLLTYISKLGKINNLNSNIFINGESGTGKSLIAKYIHLVTKSQDKPFITINCSTIPDVLFESELFGYEKGTFTGGNKNGKIGLLDLADNGTLFMDEVGEIPFAMQAKLLSVIQEHQYSPVGGRGKKKLNSHIIAATNRDLNKMVEQGEFRKDLFYRLNVIQINVPPLRKRKKDIIPMLYNFLKKFGKKYNFFHELTNESINILVNYNWPGNVRELEHVVERLVIGVDGKLIHPRHVFNSIKNINTAESIPTGKTESLTMPVDLNVVVDRLKKEMVEAAYGSHQTTYGVAKALNISQPTAFRLIQKYIKKKNPAA